MTRAYEHLAALAEQRLELARAGSWDALAGVDAEIAAVTAALPTAAPAAAAPALARVLAAGEATGPLLDAAMTTLRVELAGLHRGRTAVRGYGQVATGAERGGLRGVSA